MMIFINFHEFMNEGYINFDWKKLLKRIDFLEYNKRVFIKMLFDIKDEEMHKIREIFATFDEDGSGSITINELGDIYNALGHQFSEEELKEIMHNLDLNEDGYITFHEFLGLYKKHIFFKVQEEKLIEAFKICDCNGDKYVTLDELKLIMHEVGESLKDKQVRSMLKEVDRDGDNRINFKEFIQLMKNQ